MAAFHYSKFSIFVASCAFFCFLYKGEFLSAEDSVVPYTEDTVSDNVTELWADFDPRKDALDVEVVREWNEESFTCQYVIFTVGTFKGETSRIAAFYTYPKNAKKVPAFVWAHGGGQRAERKRGEYFAERGYATIDINWGGREIEEGITKNTDWGKVDPSQGPQFYPGSLRKSVKLDLRPDEHTIDPVVSPRNGIWYLLTYASRRAITFLERQAEVDPDKIGFTGYSMGGNITSFCAIDSRLKAVVPMVGGSGFTTSDFAGLPGTARPIGPKEHWPLYARTNESQSYWEHVHCPVLMLNATNDFHATFDAVYASLNRLPHSKWHASNLIHFNHSLGPEQWILMNLWFDHFLKGTGKALPSRPTIELKPNGAAKTATVTLSDVEQAQLEGIDIYYSHDPNPRTRFWKQVAPEAQKETWSATLPIREKLPLYAFANLRYVLGETRESFNGATDSYTITSDEASYIPDTIEASLLRTTAKPHSVFDNLQDTGMRNWGSSVHRVHRTYKFQAPEVATPEPHEKLKISVNLPKEKLSLRFRVSKNQWLTGVKEREQRYSAAQGIGRTGENEIIFSVGDFQDKEKSKMSNWENIVYLEFDIYDPETKSKLELPTAEGSCVVTKLEWIQ